MKACCGFGHRNIFENIGDRLDSAVETAIQQGCEIFYTGAMGESLIACVPLPSARQRNLTRILC